VLGRNTLTFLEKSQNMADYFVVQRSDKKFAKPVCEVCAVMEGFIVIEEETGDVVKLGQSLEELNRIRGRGRYKRSCRLRRHRVHELPAG